MADNDPPVDGQRENNRERIPDNLKPHAWKPGQSGNPKGRPKGQTFSEIVRQIMREELTMVEVSEPSGAKRKVTMTKEKAAAVRFVTSILNGDMRAIEYLGDRLDPKARSVEGHGDGRPRMLNLPAGGPWGSKATDLAEKPSDVVDATTPIIEDGGVDAAG